MISRAETIRNIRCKDSIRINWQQAVSEAEAYADSKMNSEAFQDRLDAVSLLFSIKEMYRSDDIDGYLNLIDDENNTRNILREAYLVKQELKKKGGT